MAFAGQKKHGGFLSRLRRDEAGNAISIFAAAIFPAIGLIGGGVDMSRIVLTRTSLQAACDAGSLMGRKVMGNGNWEDDNNRANARAERAFDANFASGSYGTQNLSRSFVESDGNVGGIATAEVPMTLMRIFNLKNREVEVNCVSEQRIPNTDVMFVLDVTGSMARDGGDGNPRIDGLRTASNCFYEALAKTNITAITPADCGETNDPVNINQGSVRLRFGFVPYNANVNVGKLLPQDYIADNWTYQSRKAEFVEGTGGVVNIPVLGDEGPFNSTGATGGNGVFSNWQNINFAIRQGDEFFSWFVFASQSFCSQLNAPADVTNESDGNTDSPQLISQSPDPLTFPTSQIVKTYEQSSGGETFQYRYLPGTIRFGFWTFSGCRLQRRVANTQATETFTTITPVTWTTETVSEEFDRWVYQPVDFDISGLKASDGSWNNSVQLPVGEDGEFTSVPWTGCIEERRTFRNIDGNPTDDWDPIPTDANDLNIDMQPAAGDSNTLWAPQLPEAVWARGVPNGAFFTSGEEDFNLELGTFNSDDAGFVAHRYGPTSSYPLLQASCPSEAATLQEWEPEEFSGYLSGLITNGNTYHDIGLLWGARFMSTTGLFNNQDDENLNFDKDSPDAIGVVDRHLIFMTDGGTSSFSTDYSAYGINWWDRRQTTTNQDGKYSTAGTDNGHSAHLGGIVDARTRAICDHVKDNMNTTLWVVSFGGDVDATTETSLQQCASPNKFFRADDSQALINQFKAIASAISNLRLSE